MLAASSHPWKVNFCKFTNETRNGIEDATENSGQTYLAALNGTASGGGYELALACDQILLVDDRSSAVSLPELPLLGVLPGTGGLTRVVDKRHVRRDRADYFSTKAEGLAGKKAVAWKLVDEAVPRARWKEAVEERAVALASTARRLPGGPAIELAELEKERTADSIRYSRVAAVLDRDRAVAEITVTGPSADPPASMADVYAQGASFWPLAVARELDDLILDLRTNETEIGTWVFRTRGDAGSAPQPDPTPTSTPAPNPTSSPTPNPTSTSNPTPPPTPPTPRVIECSPTTRCCSRTRPPTGSPTRSCSTSSAR